MWFLYAFSGAFFKSLSGFYRKKAADIPSAVFAWLNSLIFIVVLLPFVFLLHLPVVSFLTGHLWLAFAITATTTLGLMLNIIALKKDELSFVAPLNGFIPVFALLGGWLFIGETPKLIGVVAIMTIFVGTYMMALTSHVNRWYDPIVYIAKNRAAQLSFVVALLYALSTISTKEALNLGYDPVTVLFSSDALGIVLLSYIFLTRQRQHIVASLRKHPLEIIGSSLSSLIGSVLHNFAVATTFASYALAIRRFDAVFAVLLGWRYLKESHIRTKLAGAIVITIGSVLLAITH